MRRRLLSLAISLGLCGPLAGSAQTFQAEYESSSPDTRKAVLATSDGGIVFTEVCEIVKTDALGGVLWRTEHDFVHGCTDITGGALVEAADGGYITVATYLGSTLVTNIVLFKVDALGSLVWHKEFGDTLRHTATDVNLLADGSLLVLGSAGDDVSFFHGIAIKTDASGDPIWSRRFGTTGGDDFVLEDAVELSDGSLVVTGMAFVGEEAFPEDILVAKLDSSGTPLWAHVHGRSGCAEGCRDHGRSIAEDDSGNFLIAGHSLVKTDSAGQLTWLREYQPSSSQPPPSAGFGHVLVDGPNTYLTGTAGFGTQFGIFLEVDSGSGHVNWGKAFSRSQRSFTRLVSAARAPNGFYLLGGTLDLPPWQGGTGGGFSYLVGTGPHGGTSCGELTYSPPIASPPTESDPVTLVSFAGPAVLPAEAFTVDSSPLVARHACGCCDADTDNDQDVDAADGLLITSCQGTFPADPSDPCFVADANCDGAVDTDDALLLNCQLIAGIPTQECCPPDPAVTTTASGAMCIDGPGDGSSWSWEIRDENWNPLGVHDIAGPDPATAQDLRDAFVSSIQAAGVPIQAIPVTADAGPGSACFTVTAVAPYQLYVGPLGDPDCLVSGNPSGCSFNPGLFEKKFFLAPVPSFDAPGAALLAALILLTASPVVARRLRSRSTH